MFQDFSSAASNTDTSKRLEALREIMKRENVDYFLVPHSDEHQNEYLPENAERLAWLTGFTGSAGFAIIGLEEAMVFSDGRYTIQLKEQLDLDRFTPMNSVTTPPTKWLEENLKDSERVGFDPWLITIAHKHKFNTLISKRDGAELVAMKNPIDEIWEDQPATPLNPVEIHDEKYAGKLARQKLEEIQSAIAEADADFCLLSDPTSICWLFNIRGADVVHTPLTLCYAIVPIDGLPSIFIDKRKLGLEVEAYLTQLAELHPPNQLDEQLKKVSDTKTVLVDENLVSSILGDVIEAAGGKLKHGRDPVVLPRAIKNETEITGTRKAHLRDGVAMVRFLYWLDQQEPGNVSEIDAAKQLETCRAQTADAFQMPLREISFDTISGAGANGAIVHYRVTEASNGILKNGTLYLVDSGAQYSDGTTDITRTIAIGTPPAEAVTDFTLVLKGHIQLALARFPEGTRGVDLDVLARNALWQKGKDFAHGTGHGVGSYLSVHEGPQSISKRGMEPIKPGMIISNEPGYYVEGEYGIRIENLVLAREAVNIADGNTKMMGFETLTLAPIDLRLINPAMMTDAELHWLNAYHAWVQRSLQEHLGEDERDWLEDACRPVYRDLPPASA